MIRAVMLMFPNSFVSDPDERLENCRASKVVC